MEEEKKHRDRYQVGGGHTEKEVLAAEREKGI